MKNINLTLSLLALLSTFVFAIPVPKDNDPSNSDKKSSSNFSSLDNFFQAMENATKQLGDPGDGFEAEIGAEDTPGEIIVKDASDNAISRVMEGYEKKGN